MNSVVSAVGMIALLGSALVGGAFFAFSSFVMKALARMPASQGIAAMQSINVVVINPSFLGAFVGTALLSIAAIVLMLLDLSHPSMMFFIGGAVSYIVGTFLVTMFGNVPLNKQLAVLSATDPDAVSSWMRFVDRWTMWNHIRTVAAVLAALLYTVGIMRSAVA